MEKSPETVILKKKTVVIYFISLFLRKNMDYNHLKTNIAANTKLDSSSWGYNSVRGYRGNFLHFTESGKIFVMFTIARHMCVN
jgi:hypothetical protein